MDLGEMKEKLKSAEAITFSKHFYDPKVRIRGISEKDIQANLRDPDNLTSFEDQSEDHRGHKYGLLFKKSNKYDLRVLVSIKNKSINVITTHIQNIKRRKVLEQWLKRRR